MPPPPETMEETAPFEDTAPNTEDTDPDTTEPQETSATEAPADNSQGQTGTGNTGVNKPSAPEDEQDEPDTTRPSAPEQDKEDKPASTEPQETEPQPTEPEATEPEATEPEATEPEKNVIQVLGQVTAENNVVTQAASFGENGVSAQIPAGTLLNDNTTELVLTIEEKDSTDSGITPETGHSLQPLDVHIEGVSPENTAPITVCLGKILPNGMNIGNVTLYHVENGTANPMTQVLAMSELTAHNQFYYDPATGDTTVMMASFSEIAVVSETAKPWEGETAEGFSSGSGTAEDPYIIANADQLVYMSKMVSNYEAYAEAHYKLIADINLSGDTAQAEDRKDLMFYPIGYWKQQDGTNSAGEVWYGAGNSFTGVFDGNGNTISNIYQNTWLMDGNYDYGYWKTAMGLFGALWSAEIKNLTIENFQSDGEFTPTGCIAAYAGGPEMLFENIHLTKCNPRVYNTGNGGLVGLNYNSTSGEADEIIFRNVTVDQTNKISALWGSYDVSCGGILGRLRENSKHDGTNTDGQKNTVTFENCHVAAIMDVNNDVCANYQYYQYRYAGMFIGTVDYVGDVPAVGVADVISATDCTFTYGDWNEYWYCELVKNSLASYTHDHQFSRLTKIANISEIQDENGNWDTEGSFVLPNEDNTAAECYHIFKNSEGDLYQHFHNVADESNPDIYETKDINGDGELNDLKEDRQCYFLPFGQLWTGYGWGSSPAYNADSYENITIEEMPGGTVESGSKFNAQSVTTVAEGATVKLSDLFTLAVDETKLSKSTLAVFVSPVITETTTSTVTADISIDTNNWGESTLIFSGTGAAKIVITDYFYCTPTVLNIEVTEREPVEKFNKLFTGDFLYRVGNDSSTPVKLSSLFEAKTGAEIGNVAVTVETITGATGTYTASSSDWTQGTIQFSGTGVVKVTITDNDYCIPTELYLEVVDAKNVTSATSATANNVVLLNNTSGSFTVSNGWTFYGNGFKVTCSGNGSYGSKALSYGFVTVENGGVLDNVKIICDIFPESYLYTSEMTADSSGRYPYAYSAVAVTGNSTISNCYIYGARNNIFVGSGNVTIENTVTECGSLSNIQIKSSDAYTVTLDDVTTIQYQTTSSYDSSAKVLGFGIVVGDNESASNAKIKLTGDLKQYNWVTSSNTSVSNTYAKTAITQALKVTEYQHTINNTTTVNMGIAYLNALTADITDERENKSSIPYALNSITMSGQTGQVYSISGSGIAADSRYDATTDGVIPYSPVCNNAVLPTVAFTGTQSDALTFTYAYDASAGGWLSKFVADLDNVDGGSYTFNFSDVNVQKYGQTLSFTAKDSGGNTVTSVSLSELFTGEYTLEITDTLFFDASGSQTGESVTHAYPFVINATKTSIDPPVFTNAGTATAIRLVESSGGDWRPAYTALTGVSVTYWSASESKVKTVDLSTLYNSGTISSNVWTYTCDDFTLTITGGAVHSDGSVITPVVANNTLYFASTNKAFGTGTTSRSMIMNYVFTDKNASTPWNRTETVTYSELSEYDYDSFKDDGTLEEATSSNPCVTPDTLVTLADGTQKEIQYVTYEDDLLVWDFVNGEYTAIPASYLVNHGYGTYDIIHLNFDDGTTIKVVNQHGFFHTDSNKFVFINKENVVDYIGDSFIKQTGDSYCTTKLISYKVTQEYTESVSIMSTTHYNCILEGLLTLTPPVIGGNYFMPFEVGENLTFDAEKMQADIETYGLFTYEEFADVVTEEVFYALNAPQVKVAVGKGIITMEDLYEIIATLIPEK